MRKYPTKTSQFGDYVQIYQNIDDENDPLIMEAKNILMESFENFKKEIECDGDKVFCHYNDDLEWIVRYKSYYHKGYDPLYQYSTVGWKCTFTGRAFYMRRFPKPKKKYVLNPNKKHIRKNKRGRPVIKKGKKIELPWWRDV